MPKVAPKNQLACELTTRKLTLDVSAEGVDEAVDAMLHMIGECDDSECLALIPVAIAAVPVTSFAVSGSIVVAGNTMHWLEQQGRCENSSTQKALKRFKKATQSLGGSVIHSGKEFVAWLKQI